MPQERFGKPLWDKQRDCRLLVSQEMGFGDVFMFTRFLPIIKERYNLELQFECMSPVYEIMQTSFPEVKCVLYGQADELTFDYQLPMMSLPFVLDLRNDNVPWDGPYLKVEQSKIDRWKEKLNLPTDKLNIGVCWAGGSRNHNASNFDIDRKRSLSFEQIKPLLECDANFVSLQVDSDSMPKLGIKDFADTAAVIELLDGVVTVDTSVANLAGALGKKVYLMNRYDACWRWARELKTPWFPTVEEYRQLEHGKWGPVIHAIAMDLEHEINLKKAANSNALISAESLRSGCSLTTEVALTPA